MGVKLEKLLEEIKRVRAPKEETFWRCVASGLVAEVCAELAEEKAGETVVEIGTGMYGEGNRRFYLLYTDSDQGSMSPDCLRALGLSPGGRYTLAIRRLPDPKPTVRPYLLPAIGKKLCPVCNHRAGLDVTVCGHCRADFGEPRPLPE